jgi:type IV secretory pathway VirB2 component (pilin)
MGFIANLCKSFTNISGDLIKLSLSIAVICLIVGGITQMTNGREGLQKAKPWYFGTCAGVIIALASKGIVEYIQTMIPF